MRIIALFILIACTWCSCTNDTTTTKEKTVLPPKTKPEKLPKEKIEAYTNAVKIVKSAVNGEESFEDKGIKYDIKTVHLDDRLVKLTTDYKTDEFEDKAIYYIRNEGLVMYDHIRTSIPQQEGEMAEAVATKVYLEQGEIIEVMEKSKKAKPGGNLSLMDEYFTPIEVDKVALKAQLKEQLDYFKGKLKK